MAVLRRPDGSLAFQTSDGLTVPMGERALRELGLELPGLDPAATAQNIPPEALAAMAGTARGPGSESTRQIPDVGTPTAKKLLTPESAGAQQARETKELNEQARKLPDAEVARRRAALEEKHGGSIVLSKAETDEAKAKYGVERFGATVEKFDEPKPEGAAPAVTRASSFRRIPGGDVRTGYTRKVGAPDEDVAATKEAIGKAGESEQNLVWQDAEFENAQRQREVQLLGEEIAAQRQSLDATKWRKQQAEERIRNETEELNGEREKVASLEQAPYNYWAGQNTFAKVMAFIGAAAGGMLAGLQGTENQFLKHLDKTIADDKAERMAKINARKKGYQVRQDALDRFAEKHDPVIAEREIEARQRLLSATLLEQHAKKTGNPLLIAKAGALADKVKAKAYQDMAQVDQELGDQIVEQIQNIPDRYVGGGAAPANEGDVRALAAARQAAGLNEASAESGNIHDLLSELPAEGAPTDLTRAPIKQLGRTIIDKVGGYGTAAEWFDSDAERAASQKLSRVQSALISKLSGANVPPAEYERIKSGIYASNTPQGLSQWSNEIDRANARKEAGVKAGFKPEVVQTYEERQRAREPARRPSGARRE